MQQPQKVIRGFSLIELFITLVVLFILGAMALPAYHNFKHRNYYSDIVKATAPYQEGVKTCYENLMTVVGCNGGTHHIPDNITKPQKPILSLTVKDGVITVVPTESKQTLTSDDFIYTPEIVDKQIKWKASGKAVKKDYAP